MLHLDRCWPGWSGRVPCVVRWSRCAEAGALEQSRASRKLVVSGNNECLFYTTKPRSRLALLTDYCTEVHYFPR